MKIMHLGNRPEALLWAVMMIGLPVFVEIEMALYTTGMTSMVYFKYPQKSPTAYVNLAIFTCVLLVLCAVGMLISRMRGTTIIVSQDQVEIQEWYGLKRLAPLPALVSISRYATIAIFGRYTIAVPLPFPGYYVLEVGDKKAFLNLSGFKSPQAEADHLLALMAQQ